MMGERLADPPLVEAVCEFRFESSPSWDWTIAGRLYDKIGHEFSERAQVASVNVQFQPGAEGPPETQIAQGLALIQMKRPDGSALVQVGQNLLVVNHLRPYVDWETYRTIITRAYDDYVAIAGQAAIQRLGLRYINQIPMESGDTDLATIISTEPPLRGSLARTVSGFYQRFELLHDAPKGVLVLQIGVQIDQSKHYMVVDLDFGSRPGPAAERGEDLIEWLDQAHDAVEQAFLDSLSSQCLARLKEGSA